MAPPRAAGRPGSWSESELRADDKRWLQTLSEPELDLLVRLREVAVTRASNAGHPALADTVFHLRALRALGIVLLQDLKERLSQTSANANVLDSLALLNDPDPEHEPVVVSRPTQDHQMPVPNGIRKKRKQQVHDGWDGEDAQTPKRRKAREE